VPALIEATRDSSVYVRRVAAEALGKVGAVAKSAVPALLEAMEDADEMVDRNAGEALKKIDPEAAKKAGVR
jgi:HEAT repeat protein